MDRRTFLATASGLAAGLGLGGAAKASAAQAPAALSKPRPAGGKSLEEALWARKSTREYADAPLAEDLLSGLLWAACGVNRPEVGRRTSPTAMNRQEIDVYVAKADGLFLYDAKTHGLTKVGDKDIRALTGKQSYVGTAPVNLVYVSNMDKAAGSTQEDKLLLTAADTGFVSQNVYLYCAAQGLATVVRANIDNKALAKAMGLAAHQRIILAQCVGHPKT